MTKLSCDIDNFSGKHSRGVRYDIISNGSVIYHDVSESEVDFLCDEMERKPWLYDNIEVVSIKK